jgi:phosphatidylserine/phosphatidylglycerophosphate/cardiolipin synthase-like enzyme
MPPKRVTLLSVLFAALLAARPLDRPASRPADLRPVTRPAAAQDGIAVFFSPDGGAAAAIVEQINAARSTLDIQAYVVTSTEIAKAILDAHRRGMKVCVILDKSQHTGRYSSATFLSNEGVPVWIDADHAIAHNKVMLIDDQVLITGSFNFTRKADEANAENLLIIQNKRKLLAAYAKNFERHMADAEPYAARR